MKQELWKFQRDLKASESDFKNGFDACKYQVLKLIKKHKERKSRGILVDEITKDIEKI